MKKLLAVIGIVAALHVVLYGATNRDGQEQPPSYEPTPVGAVAAQTAVPSAAQPTISNPELARAFKNGLSNILLQGYGVVKKVLPDDYDGSRHQRFILDVGGQQTILVAHNIDIAPRIAAIQKGDTVEFFGEYEWKTQGGVIHWTHHDPARRHPAGWLRHNGQVYQ